MQKRMQHNIGALFATTERQYLIQQISPRGREGVRIGMRAKYYGVDAPERWYYFSLSGGGLEAPAIYPESVYRADANVILALPNPEQKMLGCEGGEEWGHVGARVLRNSGWRPDCSVVRRSNSIE